MNIKTLKKVTSAAVCAALACTSVLSSAKTLEFTMNSTKMAESDKGIEIKTLETAPYTKNDRTMVPIRIISESFGARVDWVEETSTVLIGKGGKNISLTIGSDTATVDGVPVTLDAAPEEINGRTMVPIRFVSENLGMNVEYIEVGEQVVITDSAPVLKVNGMNFYIDDYRSMLMYTNSGATKENIETITDYFIQLGAVASAVNPIDDADTIDSAKSLVSEYYDMYVQNGYIPNDRFLGSSHIKLMYNDSLVVPYISSKIAQGAVSEEEIRQKYESEYICAKHILIPTTDLQTGEPFSAADKSKAQIKAMDIAKKLKRSSEFDAVMAEYSEDPGSAVQPDGYVFTKGEMVKEFEDAAFALKVGEISSIVETAFGYHIIKREALPEITEELSASIAAEILYNNMVESAASQQLVSTNDLEQLLSQN